MKLLIQTQTTFERDLKRIKKRNKDLKKLHHVLRILAAGDKLPDRYRNHKLAGNYNGFWECHIEPDWLLIYKTSTKALILIRTGSHSDLF